MKETKVTLREEASFFFVNLGNIPVQSVMSAFLMIFYTNVVGLDVAKVATLFLIARVVDGLSDPIMGMVIDRLPRNRMGHFRPGIIFGSIITSLNLFLLWFGPVWVSSGKYVVAYITYLLIGVTFDIMDISLNSMLPVMTDNLPERDRLALIKKLGYSIGAFAVGTAGPYIVVSQTLGSYYVLITIVCVWIVLFSVLGTLGIHERVVISEKKQDQYSIQDIGLMFRYRPVIAWILVAFVGSVANNLSMGTYFFTYVIGDLTKMAPLTMINGLLILPSAMLSPMLLKKLGKKKTWLLATGLCVIISATRWVNPTSLMVIYVTAALSTFCNGFTSPLDYSIPADNTNYLEYKTGKHMEGIVASTQSFVIKCGSGIGGALPGYLLAWAGFDSTLPAQPVKVLTTLIFLNAVLPVIVNVLRILIFSVFYSLDSEKMTEVNQEISRRHAQTESRSEE